MVPEIRFVAPGWLTIAVGFAVIAVSTAAARTAGLHRRLGALPVLVVAAVCCVRSTPGAALFVAGLGWAFTNTLQSHHPSPLEESQRG